jgi:hypothetical protein
MRIHSIALLLSLPILAYAQDVVPSNSSGAETITKENAESLGFKVEVTNVGELVRFRVVLPDAIHNGFAYSYTRAEVQGSDGGVILVFRPEAHVESLSDSKYVLFVAPANVLPCLKVSAIYLNPERPMHSDYFMIVDVLSFIEGDTESCQIRASRLSTR